MLPYLTAAIVCLLGASSFLPSFDRDSRQLIKAKKKIQNNEIHVPVVKGVDGAKKDQLPSPGSSVNNNSQ